ncbi:MAG: alpha/beta hydrolase [Candidatus Tectimicrobiota bacterium]
MAISTRPTSAIDIEDVEYLRHGDKPLLARLYKPKGPGPFPLIVELHGGAWCRGDRLNEAVLNEALARSGVVVAALDFRMPPDASYPGSLADIHYGIRWCKTQAASWGSRPEWVGATGSSSGAHQAMLIGMRPDDPRYAALPLPAGAPAVDARLRYVILCSPVIDPLGRYLYAKGLRQDCTPPAGFGERVVPSHDQYWQTEAAMAEGAPARFLAAGERTELPPVLYLSRPNETSHPRPDLDAFVKQYRLAGGQVDLEIFEGEGEGFLTKTLDTPGSQRAFEQMVEFIHQHMG